jgi:hypothetical protein
MDRDVSVYASPGLKNNRLRRFVKQGNLQRRSGEQIRILVDFAANVSPKDLKSIKDSSLRKRDTCCPPDCLENNACTDYCQETPSSVVGCDTASLPTLQDSDDVEDFNPWCSDSRCGPFLHLFGDPHLCVLSSVDRRAVNKTDRASKRLPFLSYSCPLEPDSNRPEKCLYWKFSKNNVLDHLHGRINRSLERLRSRVCNNGFKSAPWGIKDCSCRIRNVSDRVFQGCPTTGELCTRRKLGNTLCLVASQPINSLRIVFVMGLCRNKRRKLSDYGSLCMPTWENQGLLLESFLPA